MKRSVNRISCPRASESGLLPGWIVVVDVNGSAVAELEDTRRHHLVTRLDAGDDRDLIAATATELDELLAHAPKRLTVRILQVGHDEHRITERRVADGGAGQRDDRTASSHRQFRLDEHAGAQRSVRIGERRLHLNIARGFVHASSRSRSRVRCIQGFQRRQRRSLRRQ